MTFVNLCGFLSVYAVDHPIMMGFEPLVNQRLLPPTFPRYAKIIKREDMVAYFSKLIERIKTVCDVINTTNLHGILVNIDNLETQTYPYRNIS